MLGTEGSMGEQALVLGNAGPSLTVIRSLAKAGFEVIASHDAAQPLVRRSRYASQLWAYPSPHAGERDFVQRLNEFLRRCPAVTVVFPVDERMLSCLGRHDDELLRGPTFVMPDPTVLAMCLDKR